jgi:hypothetical protein
VSFRAFESIEKKKIGGWRGWVVAIELEVHVIGRTYSNQIHLSPINSFPRCFTLIVASTFTALHSDALWPCDNGWYTL